MLLKKTGSQSPEKRFWQMVRHLAEHDHLPDYTVEFDNERDQVIFRNRGTMKSKLAGVQFITGKPVAIR